MALYWAILFLPALFAVHPIKFDSDLRNIAFFLTGILLVILIGFRHEVGGDWLRYLDTAYGIQKGLDFDFLSFYSGDYAYRFIHWLSVNYFNGIYTTNLICALFFVYGLLRFCKELPFPWVALFVSIPFLIIVVSMGYTRQAAAIGFLMLGLIKLMHGKSKSFYILVMVGSLFHMTVFPMLLVGSMYGLRCKSYIYKLFTILIIIFSLLFLYTLFIDQISTMIYYYITIKFHHSDGAVVRVLMNFIPAVIFFIYRRKFREEYHDEKLWLIFSVASIAMFPIAFYYSTFIDRIAIYFIPIQMVIFSRVITLVKSKYERSILFVLIFFLYFSALFVWLNFGNFSSFWLPYQNILLI